MNTRTARLLRKYKEAMGYKKKLVKKGRGRLVWNETARNGNPVRALKDWWNSLTVHEKFHARTQMEKRVRYGNKIPMETPAGHRHLSAG